MCKCFNWELPYDSKKYHFCDKHKYCQKSKCCRKWFQIHQEHTCQTIQQYGFELYKQHLILIEKKKKDASEVALKESARAAALPTPKIKVWCELDQSWDEREYDDDLCRQCNHSKLKWWNEIFENYRYANCRHCDWCWPNYEKYGKGKTRLEKGINRHANGVPVLPDAFDMYCESIRKFKEGWTCPWCWGLQDKKECRCRECRGHYCIQGCSKNDDKCRHSDIKIDYYQKYYYKNKQNWFIK